MEEEALAKGVERIGELRGQGGVTGPCLKSSRDFPVTFD
jgi:hypothetical protein